MLITFNYVNIYEYIISQKSAVHIKKSVPNTNNDAATLDVFSIFGNLLCCVSYIPNSFDTNGLSVIGRLDNAFKICRGE